MQTKEQLANALNTHVLRVAAVLPRMTGSWRVVLSEFGAQIASEDEPSVALVASGLTQFGPRVAMPLEILRSHALPDLDDAQYQAAKSSLRSIDAVLLAAQKAQIHWRSLLDQRWSEAPDRNGMQLSTAAAPALTRSATAPSLDMRM